MMLLSDKNNPVILNIIITTIRRDTFCICHGTYRTYAKLINLNIYAQLPEYQALYI